MEKFVSFLWFFFDAAIILGLGVKVLAGDGGFVDWIGLLGATLVGLSTVSSWIFKKNPDDCEKNAEDE